MFSSSLNQFHVLSLPFRVNSVVVFVAMLFLLCWCCSWYLKNQKNQIFKASCQDSVTNNGDIVAGNIFLLLFFLLCTDQLLSKVS